MLSRYTKAMVVSASALLFIMSGANSPSHAAQAINFEAFDKATHSPPPISVNEVKLFLNRIERMANRKKMTLKYNHLAKDGVAMERIGNQISYYDRSTYDEKLGKDYKDLKKMQYRINVESVNVNGNRAYFRSTVYQKALFPDYELIRKQEWQKQKLKEEAAKLAAKGSGGPMTTIPVATTANAKPKAPPVFIKDPKKEESLVYREMGTVEKRDGKLVFVLYSTEKLALPSQAAAGGGGVGVSAPSDGSGTPGSPNYDPALDPSLMGG